MLRTVALALAVLSPALAPAASAGPVERALEILDGLRRFVEDTYLDHDDAGTGADAGNTPDAATPVELGRIYLGERGPRLLDPIDWFVFTVPPNSLVSTCLGGVHGPDAIFLDEAGVEHGPSWYYNWCAPLSATTVAGGEWRLGIASIPNEYSSLNPSELVSSRQYYSFTVAATPYEHGAEIRVDDASGIGLRVAFGPVRGIGETVSVPPAGGDSAFAMRAATKEGNGACYEFGVAGFRDAPGSGTLAAAGGSGLGASVALPDEPGTPAPGLPVHWGQFLRAEGYVNERDIVTSRPQAFRVNLLWDGDVPPVATLRETGAVATFARIGDFSDAGPAASAGPLGAAAAASLALTNPPDRTLVVGVDARHEPGAVARWASTNDAPEDPLVVVRPDGSYPVRDAAMTFRFAAAGDYRVDAPRWANVEDGRLRVAAATFPKLALCA